MTIPLVLTLDAAAMGAEHIGYQVRVPLKDNGTVELVTIARVLPLYNRPHHVRLEFAEYPGYHYDITGQVMLCAVVEPVVPAAAGAGYCPDHPDAPLPGCDECAEAATETPTYVNALRRMWRSVRQYDSDAIARAGYRDAIRDLAYELGVDLDG